MKPEFLEICKKAIDATIEQNAQSVGERGACAYRGKNGLKCAVGHMIPDELYLPQLENKTVTSSVVKAVIKKAYPEIDEEDFVVLTRLQDVHDLSPNKVEGESFAIRFTRSIAASRFSFPDEIVDYAKQKLDQLQEQPCPSP